MPILLYPQYDNNLLASFFLWTENRLGQQLGAYQTVTTQLYPTSDPSLPAGYQGYSAPLKSWVYDSGISGAYIINAISGGGFSAPLTRASGVIFDYINARAIVPTSLGTGLAVTGTYSFREVNCYMANESEDSILTQSKYFTNPRYVYGATGGVPPYVLATPAVFVNELTTRNDAYQFGGLVDTKSTMSLTVLAESNFQLTAILGAFRDSRYQNLPMFNTIDDPLDQWGDVKGGTGYNYMAYVGRFGVPGNLIYVENVRVSKVSDSTRINPLQFAGIVDLDLSYIRQAPISSNIFV